MRLMTFSARTMKEIMRDPLDLSFGLGFPLIVLFLLTAIQAGIPVSMFELPELTPGITVFGLSFMTLFSALLIAKDRESALFQRLYTTPLTACDFIVGYALPFLPIALAQAVVVYLVSFALGLDVTPSVIWAVLGMIPIALFFIGMGLLCGSSMGSRQVGGVCGALFTNLAAWLSGTWFDPGMVGGAFKAVADALPFIHAVEMERAILAGNMSAVLPHFAWVAGYAVLALLLAVLMFLRQMKRQ